MPWAFRVQTLDDGNHNPVFPALNVIPQKQFYETLPFQVGTGVGTGILVLVVALLVYYVSIRKGKYKVSSFFKLPWL